MHNLIFNIGKEFHLLGYNTMQSPENYLLQADFLLALFLNPDDVSHMFHKVLADFQWTLQH
jgi:hypothetical protein